MSSFQIAGIVPAAGVSRRMGKDKRRLLIGSDTMLEKSVNSLITGECSPVVVVLEPHSPCRNLPLFQDKTKNVILKALDNASPSMLYSICQGLEAVENFAEAIAVLPGDCPGILSKSILYLNSVFWKKKLSLLVPTYRGQQGHPRYIHKNMFEQLKNLLTKSERFSTLFQLFYSQTTYFEIDDPSIIQDADTPDEYNIILKKFN